MTCKALVLTAVLAGAMFATACGSDATTASAESQTTAPPAPLVDVAAVRATHGTIHSALEISGTLTPRTRVGVKPKLPGRLERVLVDIGDRVTAGQVIATIDRRELDAQVDAATAAIGVADAAIESAEAALENAMSEHTRAKNLFEGGALPRQRLEAAETALRSASAQRNLARANLAQAQAALRRARSPEGRHAHRARHRRHRRTQLRRRRDSRRPAGRGRRRHPPVEARGRRL